MSTDVLVVKGAPAAVSAQGTRLFAGRRSGSKLDAAVQRRFVLPGSTAWAHSSLSIFRVQVQQ